tara:strand:- start:1287 stop:1490 length:204 start_codon:yes stop_codon:yes gene_type:complete
VLLAFHCFTFHCAGREEIFDKDKLEIIIDLPEVPIMTNATQNVFPANAASCRKQIAGPLYPCKEMNA